MATASSTQRTPREVIEFAPNAPVTVALKYNQGKHVVGQYGDRMMFSTTDGRIFFLDPFVAGQIEAAGINVRESFTITLKWDGVKGSQRTWEIARVAGEQPNGTFAVPRLPEAKPAQRANSAAGRPEALLDEANALIDTFAAAWDRARTKYEGRLKPEEVKALVITAYIQHNKLSSVA